MRRRRPSYHALSDDPTDWEPEELEKEDLDDYRPMTGADQDVIDNAMDANNSRLYED